MLTFIIAQTEEPTQDVSPQVSQEIDLLDCEEAHHTEQVALLLGELGRHLHALDKIDQRRSELEPCP